MDPISVSVVIPVFNAAPYLAEAVESVLDQADSHIQIIIVDDGSTDESGSIADRFAERRSVEVLHCLNRGPGPARNVGIKRATGQYIFFLDSDDRVPPDFLERVRTRLQAFDYPDLLLFDQQPFYTVLGDAPTHEDEFRRKASTVTARSGVDVLNLLIDAWGLCPQPSGYISKTKIWQKRDVRFPDVLHEDETAFVELMLASHSVWVVEEALAEHRITPGSIMNREVAPEHIEGLVYNLEYFIALFRRHRWSDAALDRALLVYATEAVRHYAERMEKNGLHKNYGLLLSSLLKLHSQEGWKKTLPYCLSQRTRVRFFKRFAAGGVD